MSRCVVLMSMLLAVLPVAAQDSDALHEFTDKKGTKILASLLSVSEDRTTMKIRREDGIEFESEINRLSLDDQQFVKNWLQEDAAAASSEFRIEITASRKSGATEKLEGKSESYSYERRFATYEISVRNLSREDLPATRVEYAILWDDQVTILRDGEGEWTFDYPEEGEAAIVKHRGVSELAAIPFNRQQTISTDPYSVDRMYLVGNLYREDEPLGLVARVVGEDGTVLAETKLGKSEVSTADWDAVLAYADPRGEQP